MGNAQDRGKLQKVDNQKIASQGVPIIFAHILDEHELELIGDTTLFPILPDQSQNDPPQGAPSQHAETEDHRSEDDKIVSFLREISENRGLEDDFHPTHSISISVDVKKRPTEEITPMDTVDKNCAANAESKAKPEKLDGYLHVAQYIKGTEFDDATITSDFSLIRFMIKHSKGELGQTSPKYSPSPTRKYADNKLRDGRTTASSKPENEYGEGSILIGSKTNELSYREEEDEDSEDDVTLHEAQLVRGNSAVSLTCNLLDRTSLWEGDCVLVGELNLTDEEKKQIANNQKSLGIESADDANSGVTIATEDHNLQDSDKTGDHIKPDTIIFEALPSNETSAVRMDVSTPVQGEQDSTKLTERSADDLRRAKDEIGHMSDAVTVDDAEAESHEDVQTNAASIQQSKKESIMWSGNAALTVCNILCSDFVVDSRDTTLVGDIEQKPCDLPGETNDIPRKETEAKEGRDRKTDDESPKKDEPKVSLDPMSCFGTESSAPILSKIVLCSGLFTDLGDDASLTFDGHIHPPKEPDECIEKPGDHESGITDDMSTSVITLPPIFYLDDCWMINDELVMNRKQPWNIEHNEDVTISHLLSRLCRKDSEQILFEESSILPQHQLTTSVVRVNVVPEQDLNLSAPILASKITCGEQVQKDLPPTGCKLRYNEIVLDNKLTVSLTYKRTVKSRMNVKLSKFNKSESHPYLRTNDDEELGIRYVPVSRSLPYSLRNDTRKPINNQETTVRIRQKRFTPLTQLETSPLESIPSTYNESPISSTRSYQKRSHQSIFNNDVDFTKYSKIRSFWNSASASEPDKSSSSPRMARSLATWDLAVNAQQVETAKRRLPTYNPYHGYAHWKTSLNYPSHYQNVKCNDAHRSPYSYYSRANSPPKRPARSKVAQCEHVILDRERTPYRTQSASPERKSERHTYLPGIISPLRAVYRTPWQFSFDGDDETEESEDSIEAAYAFNH